ncbi:penicillin-binding protein 2 [Streptomyces hirsutus]
MTKKTLAEIDGALEGVATRGTAAWRFGGWPQDEIPMHAKTGTAEVYGKQTTSWFATYTKDYSVVMTIAQGGTGSGASGPAVRNIYNALYGVSPDGVIDEKKALLPTPQKTLPKVRTDGTIVSPKISKDPAKDQRAAEEDEQAPADGQAQDQDQDATTTTPPPANRDTRRRDARRGGARRGGGRRGDRPSGDGRTGDGRQEDGRPAGGRRRGALRARRAAGRRATT